MKPLSARQKQTLDFITDYVAKHGCMPLIKQVAFGLGYNSLGCIIRHVDRLVERGYLTRQRPGMRSVSITELRP